MLGVSLALLVSAAMLGAACSDSATTPAQTPTPTPTFDELSQTAKRVSWEELYRNNETYLDELVYLKGEVLQVIADGNSDRYELRVAVAEADGGYDFAEVVFVRYEGTERLLEDDVVEIVGNVEGLHTYFSLGGPQTIPEITDAKIRRSGAATITPLPTFTPEPIDVAQSSSSATAATSDATPASINTPLPTFTPESTSVPTTTPEPTATPLPTNTPAPTATPEPTNTATPTPTHTPVPVGSTRHNPIPFGDPITTSDGFSLWIEYLIDNATQTVLDEDPDTELPAGHQFLKIRIKVKNNAAETRRFGDWWRLYVVGASSIAYELSPVVDALDPFDRSRKMFQGGELSGNIYYIVKSSDIDTLVMYDEQGGDRLFWVLPPSSTVASEPTHTPHPTHTPEPTHTPHPTFTPEPTATPTPIPIGASEDNPIPYRDKGLLTNTDNFYLRVVSVFQGKRADALFSNAPKLDADFTRVAIRIKVQNDGARADNYAATRIRAFGLKSKQSYTDWWRFDDSNYCGSGLEADWSSYEDIAPGSSQTGNICFVAPKFDAGALLLVDDGGRNGSYEDWRYWKLR